jgi:hypothetical protein
MRLRRPMAALFTALALFGGGTATLSGCAGDPAGLDRSDGTPDDHTTNTQGNDPSSDSQGNLPDNSNRQPGDTEKEKNDTQNAG